MCIDMKYKNLFAADNFGYIYNWNIDNYAKVKEKNPPECNLKLSKIIVFKIKI
jgi:hypothetical protein